MLATFSRTIVAAALLSGFAGTATAETWNMATPYPESNFHAQNHLQFAKDVKAATNGALEIVVHANGSLIPHAEIRNAVRNGTVPMGEFLLSRLSNENPIYEIDMVPFFVTDYPRAKRLWQVTKERIQNLLARQNIQVLYAVPWPNNGIYANKELRTIDDFRGLKFRSYTSTTERFAQLTGAVPTQVEIPDIAQAFATGRVESMITSAATGVNISAWDFVKRYYDTKSYLGKNVVIVSKKKFDGLSKDVQQAVLKAAAVAEERGWKMSADDDKNMAAKLAKGGVIVEKPTPALEASLQKIGTQMLDDWLTKAGTEGKAIVDELGR